MVQQLFDKILQDTANGSTDIFIKFLEFVRTINPTLTELEIYIDDLKRQYSEMLVIQNGCEKLEKHVAKYKDIPEAARILQNEINTYNFQILKNLKQKVTTFAEKACITISNSLTLQFALQDLDFKEIYIMRSNPGGEGLYLYDKVPNAVLIEDERANPIMKSGLIDIVLMGCDAYKSGQSFINKVGSRQICEIANELNIPVYILTNTLKETAKQLPKIKNKLFEEIPITSNITIITESP